MMYFGRKIFNIEDLDFLVLMFFLVCVAFAFILVIKMLSGNANKSGGSQDQVHQEIARKTIDPNLIQDKDVTVAKVLKSIEEFRPVINPDLKEGYTEKSMEKELDRYLKTIFQSVRGQFPLADSRKGDIDVGSGRVGVELKLARQLLGVQALNGLGGQLDGYVDYYKSPSKVILVVIGDENHKRDARITDVERLARKKGMEFDFILIG